MRTMRASRGMASPTASERARAGQKLDATNGKLPPSGKATASAIAGPSAQAASATGHQLRRSSHQAALARATKAPATGLAALESTARAQAQPRRPRAAARTAAKPTATPSAKVSRPVMRLVAVATANHSAATRPPSRSRTRRSKSHAAATALRAPTRRAPSTPASAGKSTL
jgi:hypothetical protein